MTHDPDGLRPISGVVAPILAARAARWRAERARTVARDDDEPSADESVGRA